jgi:hypothetical protein
MSRIQAAAESSQVGRVWAAAQNLAEHDMILRPQLRRISLKTRRIKIATFLQNCLDRCRF